MFSVELLLASLFAGLLGGGLRELFWSLGWVDGVRRRKNLTGALATSGAAFFIMLLIGQSWGDDLYLPLSAYVGLLVSFSAVDIEEKVIPKYVWGGGFFFALAVSHIFPKIIDWEGAFGGLTGALTGAVVSGGIIFAMVEMGKLMFGRLHIVPEKPQAYALEKKEGQWFFSSEGESIALDEVIMRKGDRVIVENEDGTVVEIGETAIDRGGGEEEISPLVGRALKITVPREAMGFGDVKFMIMAGAMTGWEGGVFSIFAGAVLGSLVGGLLRVLKGHREIPFVPFLSAGVLLYFAMPDSVSLLFDALTGRGFE